MFNKEEIDYSKPLDHSSDFGLYLKKYMHHDLSANSEQVLVVGHRGSGKSLYCAKKIRQFLYNGVTVYTTAKPLDNFYNSTFKGSDKKEHKVSDYLNFLDLNDTTSMETWEKLYILTDCAFIDPELWARFGGKDSKDPKMKNRFREFFSKLRHNNVICIVAGQDEMQIDFEFRKSFDKIVLLRKISPTRLFFGLLRNRPMGIEYRVYDRDNCFNMSNRINMALEPLNYGVFYPVTAKEGAVFDTHNERISQEKIKQIQEKHKKYSVLSTMKNKELEKNI